MQLCFIDFYKVGIKVQSRNTLDPDVHRASLNKANKHADLWMLSELFVVVVGPKDEHIDHSSK